MPTVRIPTVLRPHAGGEARITVDGATVGEVLANLVAAHPGLEERVLEDGAIRGYVNVFVDDEDIRYLDGLATAIAPSHELSIMPAVAGGAR
jgi:sulfur-carrier protein